MKKGDGPSKWGFLGIFLEGGCKHLLSLHYWEVEVIAALWNQPHALPSCLREMRPMPSHKSHHPTLNLEWASQLLASTTPTKESQSCSITFMPPLGLQALVT